MKQSAGTLLFRHGQNGLEVLLVHPSGNYNRNAPWGIPKGIPDAEESLEEAARRETLEETGVAAQDLRDLGWVDYTKSRKRIFCFAGEVPADAAPHCASWEVDRAEFLKLADAQRLIHPDQLPLLDRFQAWLGEARP